MDVVTLGSTRCSGTGEGHCSLPLDSPCSRPMRTLILCRRLVGAARCRPWGRWSCGPSVTSRRGAAPTSLGSHALAPSIPPSPASPRGHINSEERAFQAISTCLVCESRVQPPRCGGEGACETSPPALLQTWRVADGTSPPQIWLPFLVLLPRRFFQRNT